MFAAIFQIFRLFAFLPTRSFVVGFAFLISGLPILGAPDPAYAPPEGYYAGTSGLSGESLKSLLNSIIRNHTIIPYTAGATDVWDALQDLDEDPANSENVLLIYTGVSRSKGDTNGNGNTGNGESWEREHLWPKSYGIFEDGPDTSDLFNLMACRRSVNSSRSNRIFAEADPSHPTDPGIAPPNCPDCLYDRVNGQGGLWTPRPSEKGDIARALFYMAVRYDGRDSGTSDLELGDAPNSATSTFGHLETLLRWHQEDPVSEEERRRNHLIWSAYQGNRNPFVDHPEMAAAVFGSVPDLPALTLTVNFSNINEGTSTTATVNIPSALEDPLTVSLSKSGDAADTEIFTPSHVLIPAGQTSATFTIEALTDGTADGDSRVILTAAADDYTSSAVSLLVVDMDLPGGGNTGTTSITGPGFYFQNFDSLPASSSVTWVDGTTLPAWYAQRTGSGNTIVAGSGTASTGALYSFGNTTDRALGSVGSGSSGALAWGVKFQNNTGKPVTLGELSYVGEQWRNGGSGTTHSLVVSYQKGAVPIESLVPISAPGWTVVPELEFVSPVSTGSAGSLNGNDAANRQAISSDLGIVLYPGEWITFRWVDIDHGGSDHGLSIDDFRLDWELPQAPIITSPLATNGVLGAPFSYTVTADHLPSVYEAEGLPEGLFINGLTGLIMGVPRETGTFAVTLIAGNDGGTGAATWLLTILPGTSYAEWKGSLPASPELLTNYAIGGAATPEESGEVFSAQRFGNLLILTAVVRTNDPSLIVIAEASPDLSAWTLVHGTTEGVSQEEVPAGFERKEFRVNTDGVKHFIRLRVELAEPE
jgi:endonuclease I